MLAHLSSGSKEVGPSKSVSRPIERQIKMDLVVTTSQGCSSKTLTEKLAAVNKSPEIRARPGPAQFAFIFFFVLLV